MRKRLLLALPVGLAFALALYFLAPAFNGEPRYHGKSLSRWLLLYETGSTHSESGKNDSDAASAVRHIGTNGIPWVMRWIRQERSGWKARMHAAVQKFPLMSDSSLFQEHPEFPLVWFQILRQDAVPAMPEIARVLNDPASTRKARESALCSMTFIGPDAIPPMLAIIANERRSDRDLALFYLDQLRDLGTNRGQAGEMLVHCLQDTNVNVAASAAEALAGCRIDPVLSIPALTAALKDARPRVRVVAAHSLRDFGQHARPAVADLVAAMSDKDMHVRLAVTNALARIAPEELPDRTNAEAQRGRRGRED